jgi:hypothetical protein
MLAELDDIPYHYLVFLNLKLLASSSVYVTFI